MARQVKVRGRFFVMLAVIALIVAAIVFFTRSSPVRVVYVEAGTIGQTQSMDAVIMRDETVVSTENYARVEYDVEECSLVSAGDIVASIYASGYSEKEMNNLETTRKDIREYYNRILANILDDNLETLNSNVSYYADELKTIIEGREQGNLLMVQNELENAMTERQDYLRTSKREETQLSSLYQKETQLTNSINSWKRECAAPVGGLVSFYLDGYETVLSDANYEQLTIADVRAIISGRRSQDASSSRTTTPLFKIVDSSGWSVLIIADEGRYTPEVGQTYMLIVDGYEDYIYQATVSSYKQLDDGALIKLDIDQDVLPIMLLRQCRVAIGTQYSGLKVPNRAVATVNGVTGLYRQNGDSFDFVPVYVTAHDANYSLVTPVVEDAVYQGMAVVIR